jgi:hypothetical protein
MKTGIENLFKKFDDAEYVPILKGDDFGCAKFLANKYPTQAEKLPIKK